MCVCVCPNSDVMLFSVCSNTSNRERVHILLHKASAAGQDLLRKVDFHIKPVKLHHFNPNIPGGCIKCMVEVGTLLHCMWSCGKLKVFWKEALDLISKLNATTANAPQKVTCVTTEH